MTPTSLRGVSVIIAYRQTSAERLDNLLVTIGFLRKTYTAFELIIVESDDRPKFDFHAHYDGKTQYHFFEDHGPFNRSRLLNHGAKISQSSVICFHDADMIGWPQQMRSAVDALMDSDTSDVRTPHWSILNVAGAHKRSFCNTLDFAALSQIDPAHLPPDVNVLYENQSSGITFWKKDAFIAVGGYDEQFVGWGGEDDELLIRASRLGLRWHAVPSPTFHLHHDAKDRRGHLDVSGKDKHKNAAIEFIKNSSTDELQKHAETLARKNFA